MVGPKPEGVDLPDGQVWEELSAFQRWYHRNKREHKSNVKKRKLALVKWVKGLRAAFACESCGRSNPAFIELHHTCQNEYRLRLGEMAREGYAKQTILEEIDRGRVLCANCHRSVHYENEDGPWGDSNQ